MQDTLKQLRQPLLLLVLLLCAHYARSQDEQIHRFCGTDEIKRRLSLSDTLAAFKLGIYNQKIYHRIMEVSPIEEPPGLSLVPGEIRIIPVVFHVIHKRSDATPATGTSNIPDGQILSQLDALNQKFSPWNIQFCMARLKPDGTPLATPGITRRAHDTLNTIEYIRQDADLMSLDFFPTNRYMNVWVVDEIVDSTGNPAGVQGYAYFPNSPFALDGIVMKGACLGDNVGTGGWSLNPFTQEGEVLVHEVGHWLGLEHTFNGGCFGDLSDPNKQYLIGDFCPGTPPCVEYYGSSPLNSCSDSYDAAGDLPDPIHNYMGYTAEAVKKEFESTQADRMLAVLDLTRNLLWSDANLISVGIGCIFKPYLGASTPTACQGDSVYLFGGGGNAGQNLRYYWHIYNLGDSINETIVTTEDTIGFITSIAGPVIIRLSIKDTITLDSATTVRDNILYISDCTPLSDDNANWFFGDYASVTFTANGPVPRRTAWDRRTIKTFECNISISDDNGNLLFYGGADDDPVTNPYAATGSFFRIWDANHNEMPGSPVYGHPSAAQEGISFPVPNSGGRRYYVFTTPASEDLNNVANHGYNIPRCGLYAHIIDLDSGTAGKVIRKNIPVRPPDRNTWFQQPDSATYTAEGITAIPNCDGSNYWLIVHAANEDQSDYKFHIWSYRVTDSDFVFVDSCYTSQDPKVGSIKASPDGTKIAYNVRSYELGTVDFDKATGELSNNIVIHVGDYGLSFSPDSKLLYAEYTNYGNPNQQVLVQYDLTAVHPDSGMVRISEDINFLPMQSMQIAPDGKIYGVPYDPYKDYSDRLSVIAHPNEINSLDQPNACGFEAGAVNFSFIGADIHASYVINAVDAHTQAQMPETFKYAYKSCDSIQFSTGFCGPFAWDFGDPSSAENTSTSSSPIHKFSGPGWYVVSCTVGSVTLTDSFLVGVPEIEISGPETTCDTTTAFTYSLLTPLKGNYRYEWFVNGNSVPSLNGRYIRTVLKNNSVVKLRVTNRSSGCLREDSLVVTVSAIANGLSTKGAIFSETLDPDVIIGDAGLGVSYQWEFSLDNNTWNQMLGVTGKDFDPDVLDTTIYYRRVVAGAGGCLNYSNVVAFFKNTIYLQPKCAFDSVAHIIGTKAVNGGTTVFGPEWEISEDGSLWLTLSNPGIGNGMLSWDFIGSNPLDSFFLRRKVFIHGISHGYSNVVNVTWSSYGFTIQPKDTLTCQGSGTPLPFRIETNMPGGSYSATWYIKRGGTSNWALAGSGLTINITPSSSAIDDSVFCYLRPLCVGGNFRKSHIAAIKKNSGLVSFLYEPNNFIIDETGTAILEVIPSFDIYTNPHWYNIQWQVSRNGGSSWTDIPGATYYQYMVSPSQCDKNITTFRAQVGNGCSTMLTREATAEINFSDLYIRDSYTDTGTEPDNSTLTASWTSPDIWNRWTNDSIRVHQAPKFTSLAENYSSPLYNYIYTVVRNTGDGYSKPSELYLYWSRLSSGQKWEKSWADTPANRIFSAFFGHDIPLGNHINPNPIIIPSIAPGDSLIVEYTWQPPNPFWYGDFIVFNSNPNGIYTYNGFIEHKLCYLARIETCDTTPYGMRVKETSVTSSNVRNNNNIAARNETYRKIVQPDDGGYPCCTSAGGSPRTVWTLVQNPRNGDTIINVNVATDAGFGYSAYGKVYLIMDDAFYGLFTAAGSVIYGATSTAHAQVWEMTNNSVSIPGLYFYDTTKANLGLDFIPDTIMPTSANYRFEVTQWSVSEEEVDGGAVIELAPDLPPPILGKRFLGVEEKAKTDIQPEFYAFPNPNTGTLHLSVKTTEQGTFTAKVYSNVGQLIMQLEKQLPYEGMYTYQLDLSELAAGIYYVEMRNGNSGKIDKIVLQK